MFLRLIVAVLVSTGMMSAGSAATGAVVASVDEVVTDAELLATVDAAIELLEEELDLLPAASPSRAADAGFQTARDQLAAVQRQGAATLEVLAASNLQLTPEITATLGFEPTVAGAPMRPPQIETYAAALTDLRQLRGEVAAASAPGPDRTPVVALVVGVLVLVAAGAVALSIVRRHRRRLSTAMHEALTDPLTRLANRRRLDRDIDDLVHTDAGVAALMVDVDHFKRFNDRYGHAVGDAVLRNVATLIAAQIREGDVVYRYGGEEFCVLLPGASIDDAHAIAERIRAEVATATATGKTDPVTVSIGLAEDQAAMTRTTIVDADHALFRAKLDGRNRTVISGSSPTATALPSGAHHETP
ncbi:MAG: GGDEF domain-containing protein [Actinomycetota bacterium]